MKAQTPKTLTPDATFAPTGAGLAAPGRDDALPARTEAPCGHTGAADAPCAQAGCDAGFVPDTPEKADRVLGRIAARRAAAARIRENGERMARQEEAEAERLEHLSRPALQDLARRELEGGRRKSLTLYHGVIGFRTRRAAVQVVDPGAALAWAEENLPAAVTLALDRKALADALLSTGGVAPGVTFSPAEEQF